MLTLFRRKSESTPDEDPSPARLIVQSADALLSRDPISTLVRLIKRNMSVTDAVWDRHYMHAIRRFALLAQAHPASRNHHHSEMGGLLEHSLEVTLNAVRISRGYILPPGCDPESIRGEEDRWRFGVFIAALIHDAGKLIGDVETVYTTDGAHFTHWQAWYGPMPMGAQYVYRYPPQTEKKQQGLHERLSITLLPYVVTPNAAAWLRDKPQLMAQLMGTLAEARAEGGVIREIIKKADHGSTGANLKQTTGTQSETIPQHQLLLNALVRLSGDGTLKRNQPGAPLWVTEHVTWVVGKAAMDAVRMKLKEEGHKSLPQSTSRLIQILNEHHHTIESVTGEDMWQAIIDDTNRNWSQKLSFMAFPNSVIWPSATPSVFTGEIVPADGKGKPLDRSKLPIELFGLDKSLACDANNTQCNDQRPEPFSGESESETHITECRPVQEVKLTTPFIETVDDAKSRPIEDGAKETESKSSNLKTEERAMKKRAPKKASVPPSPSVLANRHTLLKWLITGVRYHKIRINESGAPIHIVDGYIALVTPAIFDRYLEDNKTSARTLGRDRVQQLKALQGQIRHIGIHEKAQDGSDFHSLYVAGPKKQSTITVWLIKRNHFPEFEGFSRNCLLHLSE